MWRARRPALALELDATKAKLATQEGRTSELSATVAAQLLARLMPVDAAETTAARRLQEAVLPPESKESPALALAPNSF